MTASDSCVPIDTVLSADQSESECCSAVDESSPVRPADGIPATVAADRSARLSGTEVETAAEVRAFLLGLAAACTYSVANMALRGLSRGDGSAGWDMWVAGTKAFPTFLIAVVLLSIRAIRRQPLFAEWSYVWPIAVAAVFNQLGGNFAFQMSLGVIGLAISVPICFASIICSGALVGRIVLGDAVSIRTGISMAMMVASIIFLSSAAQSRGSGPAGSRIAASAHHSEVSRAVLSSSDAGQSAAAPASTGDQPGRPVLFGVALSVLSGLCYGITGVFIRKAVRSHLPVAATLFLFSAAGFLVLVPMSLCLIPPGTIPSITSAEWTTIAIAGTFNAIGFFAITHAMRHLTISRANVINASQNAMCAVGAVLFFHEPMSGIALLGIGLTIGGLLTLDRK